MSTNTTQKILTAVVALFFAGVILLVGSLSLRALRYFDAVIQTASVADGAEAVFLEYRTDEGSGNTLRPTTDGPIGTLQGAVWQTDALGGKYLFFNGLGAHVTFAGSESRHANGVALETWIRTNTGTVYPPNTDQVVLETQGGEYLYYLVDKKRFKFRLFTDEGKDIAVETPGLDISDDWVHVIGTYDGFRLQLFVNGTLAASAFLEGTVRDVSGFKFIGADPGHLQPFFGLIDNPIIYTRALNAEVIAERAKSHDAQ